MPLVLSAYFPQISPALKETINSMLVWDHRKAQNGSPAPQTPDYPASIEVAFTGQEPELLPVNMPPTIAQTPVRKCVKDLE